MPKKELVVKSNHLVEAGYQLTLNEQRVILMAITKIHRKTPFNSDDLFTIHAKEFAEQFGLDVNNAYQELVKVADQLYERTLVINQPDPDFPTLKYTKTRWISSIDYIPETGILRLMFAQRVIPYLAMLEEQFTKYHLVSVAEMSSIHAIRLYELLKQWDMVGKREVSIEWLKKQFQIEDKYPSIKDFKKYVVDLAISQINEYSDLAVSYTQRKTGRNVTHFTFSFGPKNFAKPKRSKSSTSKKKTEQGEMVLGVLKSDIERLARAGESYEQAAERIKRMSLV